MMNKNARFPNLAQEDRTEVGYATIPFKSGEWNGKPLEIVDESGVPVSDAWIYPFGAKYDDGTYRYGALMSRLDIPGLSERALTVRNATSPLTEPTFRYSEGLISSSGFQIFVAITKNSNVNSTGFSKWESLEDNGMRKVIRSRSRIGHFVAVLTLYIYNNQDLMKWELDVVGSDPLTTDRIYDFDELHLLIMGDDHYLNVRGAARRGITVISPFKHFRLMKRSDGIFGDGQKQSWYGELVTVSKSAQVAYSAAAALAFPLWGMSKDWVRDGEAYGALGVVPDTPVPLPKGGHQAVISKYVNVWKYINSQGAPWDDYPEGLTKAPGQTGSQFDFGIFKGWDILHTGMAELVEVYRFLATEEAKRPGHYLEENGEQVTSANHPRWVTWNGVTHWHFGVSPDRLGKTDPNAPYNTNGWNGKDWQHMSSNLLYIASLLTGSYQLRDEQQHEVEFFLAGHTLPSQFPGWSTNGRGEPRAFGRTHLALLHHWTVLDRQDIIDKMMDRFKQVVKNAWQGSVTNPVQVFNITTDPRVFPNKQQAWVPWNEHFGWIGIAALYRITQDKEVKQMMVDWGDTIINWGWRIETNGSATPGHGVKWLPGGAAITPQQFFNPDYWLPANSFNEWMAAVTVFAKDCNLFNAPTRARAQQIYDYISGVRMRNYNPVTKPFDTFGEWTAIDVKQMEPRS